MQPPQISAAKVASSYLITTIIKKGMNKKYIGLIFCRRWTFENAPFNLKTSAVIQHVKNTFEGT